MPLTDTSWPAFATRYFAGETVVTRVPRNLRPGGKVLAAGADGQAPEKAAAKAQETPP